MVLVSAACGGSEDPLEIGLRRVALDLAFKDEEKAVAAEPNRIVRTVVEYVDFGEEIIWEDAPEPKRRIPPVIPPRAPAKVCDVAPENDTPEIPAFHVRKGDPIVGTYERHNTGKIGFTAATLNGSIPFPSTSEWDIIDVSNQPRITALRPEDQKAHVPDPVQANTTAAPVAGKFTVVRIVRGLPTTYTTYEYSSTFLHLTERKSVARDGKETLFRPTPPIRFVALNETEGTDSEVTFAGVDRQTNVAMTITSKIVGREWVDICGEVFDSYRVEWQEQLIDMSTGSPTVSGNASDQFNVWNVQFDNGLLVLREELHYAIQTTTEVAGAPVPVTLSIDVSSVLDSMEPAPLKDRTAAASSSRRRRLRRRKKRNDAATLVGDGPSGRRPPHQCCVR